MGACRRAHESCVDYLPVQSPATVGLGLVSDAQRLAVERQREDAGGDPVKDGVPQSGGSGPLGPGSMMAPDRYACNVTGRPARPQRPHVPRLAAARRPYRRAHSDVKICAWSRTRSSSTCAGSTTSNVRPRRRQHGLDLLGPEPCEALCVLDHDRGDIRIAQQRQQLPAAPVQRRPDLGDHSIHRQVVPCRPGGNSCHLQFKVLALVSRRHAGTRSACGHVPDCPRTLTGHLSGQVLRESAGPMIRAVSSTLWVEPECSGSRSSTETERGRWLRVVWGGLAVRAWAAHG
jgi:hypothetical protein